MGMLSKQPTANCLSSSMLLVGNELTVNNKLFMYHLLEQEWCTYVMTTGAYLMFDVCAATSSKTTEQANCDKHGLMWRRVLDIRMQHMHSCQHPANIGFSVCAQEQYGQCFVPNRVSTFMMCNTVNRETPCSLHPALAEHYVLVVVVVDMVAPIIPSVDQV